MVLYYRVSSIVLNGSVLQGVPYDLANPIVLYDLHFLRVDLINIRCFFNSYSGKPEVNWCYIGVNFVGMVKINYLHEKNKENVSVVTSFFVLFFLKTLGSPFLLL